MYHSQIIPSWWERYIGRLISGLQATLLIEPGRFMDELLNYMLTAKQPRIHWLS